MWSFYVDNETIEWQPRCVLLTQLSTEYTAWAQPFQEKERLRSPTVHLTRGIRSKTCHNELATHQKQPSLKFFSLCSSSYPAQQVVTVLLIAWLIVRYNTSPETMGSWNSRYTGGFAKISGFCGVGESNTEKPLGLYATDTWELDRGLPVHRGGKGCWEQRQRF